MNILFVTEDHSIRNYGITAVVSQLADHLVAMDPDIHLSILAAGRDPVAQDPRIKIITIPLSGWAGFWGWNRNLETLMRQAVIDEKIDLIHIHGIWMASQWTALKVAKNLGIPCVVSSHGMLETWLWEGQRKLQKLKKKLYFNLVFKPALNSKVAFHAITPIEQDSLKRQLPGHLVNVIPNAINVENSSSRLAEEGQPAKQFLFLGRLHPVKAVDVLIEAFHKADLGKEWRLLIAGPEYVPEYVEKLKEMVRNHHLENQILFTGPVYGEQKDRLIEGTWALVIPSYSEVMGMVNLEAAVKEVPGITTHETGLWDWEEGGGLLTHPDAVNLSEALKKAAGWDFKERQTRGKRSRQLVAERYSWKTVIPKWIELYTTLINQNQSARKDE